MTLNGKPVENMNFFANLSTENLPEMNTAEYNEAEINRCMKDANTNGNIPLRYATTRFGDFVWEDEDKIKSFCLTKKNDGVYILMGKCGTGKTSIMAAAMHERAINGMSAGSYFSDMLLMPKLRTCRSFSATENEYDLYQRLGTTPFLCLDEVGMCENKTEERQFLRSLIALRYDNCLPTVISTNLGPCRFKLFLCDKESPEMNKEQVEELCRELDVRDPILNRIKASVTCTKLLGESHR